MFIKINIIILILFVKLFYGTIGNLLKACGLCSTIISYKLTFNLPNFNDRIPQGKGNRGGVGALLNESLPNIKGSLVDDLVNSTQTTSGAFSISAIRSDTTGSATGTLRVATLNFDASSSSNTYKDNAPVQQAAVVVCFCIKY